MSGKPMKLILTQEVTGLGAPGDVVEVKAGYGRNYLVPRQPGHAVDPRLGEADRDDQARPVGPRDPQPRRRQGSRRSAVRPRVRLQTRAGSGGRLFGSISTADIAAAVRNAGGPELDRRKIEVKNPIKTVGSHQVAVRLHPEVSAKPRHRGRRAADGARQPEAIVDLAPGAAAVTAAVLEPSSWRQLVVGRKPAYSGAAH